MDLDEVLFQTFTHNGCQDIEKACSSVVLKLTSVVFLLNNLVFQIFIRSLQLNINEWRWAYDRSGSCGHQESTSYTSNVLWVNTIEIRAISTRLELVIPHSGMNIVHYLSLILNRMNVFTFNKHPSPLIKIKSSPFDKSITWFNLSKYTV